VLLCVQGLPATVRCDRARAPARGALNGSSQDGSGSGSFFITFNAGWDATQPVNIKLQCHTASSAPTDCWEYASSGGCPGGYTYETGWLNANQDLGPFEIPAAESYEMSFLIGDGSNADMNSMSYQIVDSQGNVAASAAIGSCGRGTCRTQSWCSYQVPDDGSTLPAPQASATGDPHLQNVHGERFDLMRPGQFVLINVPRGAPINNALLTVEADAQRLGEYCGDLYFQTLRVTGKWANSSLHFDAQAVHDETPRWSKFGPVELKVAYGRTDKGLKYLNFYVKHLWRAGAAVGGLLGEDDHTEEAEAEAECRKHIALKKTARSAAQWRDASVARAYP